MYQKHAGGAKMLTHAIKSEVTRMKPIDRVHLAEFIFDSLDKPDPVLERKWVEESEKRYRTYKSGKVKGIGLAEIREKYGK
jgi:putative addiction module component (TIGR02574 family)